MIKGRLRTLETEHKAFLADRKSTAGKGEVEGPFAYDNEHLTWGSYIADLSHLSESAKRSTTLLALECSGDIAGLDIEFGDSPSSPSLQSREEANHGE